MDFIRFGKKMVIIWNSPSIWMLHQMDIRLWNSRISLKYGIKRGRNIILKKLIPPRRRKQKRENMRSGKVDIPVMKPIRRFRRCRMQHAKGDFRQNWMPWIVVKRINPKTFNPVSTQRKKLCLCMAPHEGISPLSNNDKLLANVLVFIRR